MNRVKSLDNTNYEKKAYTLTASRCVENHARMQMIGDMSSEGYTRDELVELQKNLSGSELIDLPYPDQEAFPGMRGTVLIIRNGVYSFKITPEQMFNEQASLSYDTKKFMYGRTVNSLARHNICFAGFDQEPDYENGKGRVINIDHLTYLKHVRDHLHLMCGPRSHNLLFEGNFYYDTDKTGIGYHGDSERKIVIGIRLGEEFPLVYQWYLKSNPVSQKFTLHLNSGDIYIMDEVATGNNWKLRKTPTLRHSAGAPIFTDSPEEKEAKKAMKKKK